MSNSKTVTSRDAVRAVERYVETDWMSRWQEFAAHNDDGIDELVLLRKKRFDRVNGAFTSLPIQGAVIVQVKGGASYGKLMELVK